MSKIILKHWTKGGTLVTNFSKEHLDIYAEAVKEYNSPHLVIAAPSSPHISGAMGLHDLRGKQGDLSGFWELWRCIEAEKQPDPTPLTVT
jgi:hypothetical protein